MTERSPILDASEIFRILAEHGVDYVLIGGIAVQTHGHVLPSRTPGEWVVRLG